MSQVFDDYDAAQHRARFACWAAGRAAGTSRVHRFRVAQAAQWLAGTPRLCSIAYDADDLPEPSQFDAAHRGWCQTIQDQSSKTGKPISHGVAAKLVSVFLKTLFIGRLGADDDPLVRRIDAIHPPIDRLLLNGMAAQMRVCGQADAERKWRKRANAAWSRMEFEAYQQIIDDIRILTGGALWRAEAVWIGHQT